MTGFPFEHLQGFAVGPGAPVAVSLRAQGRIHNSPSSVGGF